MMTSSKKNYTVSYSCALPPEPLPCPAWPWGHQRTEDRGWVRAPRGFKTCKNTHPAASAAAASLYNVGVTVGSMSSWVTSWVGS